MPKHSALFGVFLICAAALPTAVAHAGACTPSLGVVNISAAPRSNSDGDFGTAMYARVAQAVASHCDNGDSTQTASEWYLCSTNTVDRASVKALRSLSRKKSANAAKRLRKQLGADAVLVFDYRADPRDVATFALIDLHGGGVVIAKAEYRNLFGEDVFTFATTAIARSASSAGCDI